MQGADCITYVLMCLSSVSVINTLNSSGRFTLGPNVILSPKKTNHSISFKKASYAFRFFEIHNRIHILLLLFGDLPPFPATARLLPPLFQTLSLQDSAQCSPYSSLLSGTLLSGGGCKILTPGSAVALGFSSQEEDLASRVCCHGGHSLWSAAARTSQASKSLNCRIAAPPKQLDPLTLKGLGVASGALH